MEYTIDKTYLRALIDEEVSKVADEAYGDNGASLYDSIIMTEKDAGMVDRAINDAVDAFISRAFDICRFMSNDSIGNSRILFYVPDFDVTMEGAMKSEITHYVVSAVCAAIFQDRRAQEVQNYATRAQASMDRAVSLLKSRKHPTEIW